MLNVIETVQIKYSALSVRGRLSYEAVLYFIKFWLIAIHSSVLRDDGCCVCSCSCGPCCQTAIAYRMISFMIPSFLLM